MNDSLDGAGEKELTAQLKEQYPDADHIKISREFEEVPDFEVTVLKHETTATDFLICPRHKAFSHPHRNWDGWHRFKHAACVSGGIVGREAQMFDWQCTVKVSDLEKIAAHMLNTKLVVATDSGLAHLAILLRVPLAVIWGTPVGVIPGQEYHQGCHRRMEHQKRSPVWHIEGGWENPSKAFEEVNQILCGL